MKVVPIGPKPVVVFDPQSHGWRAWPLSVVTSALSEALCGRRTTVIALQSAGEYPASNPVFWSTLHRNDGRPDTHSARASQLNPGTPTYVQLRSTERIFAWSPIGEETQITCWEAGAQPAFEQSGFLTGIKSRRVPAKSDKRSKMWRAQGGQCALCRRLWPEHLLTEMTVDHIVPRSKGGDDSDGNLQLTCLTCNASKRDMDNDDAKMFLQAAVHMSDPDRAQALREFREKLARKSEVSEAD